MVIGWMFASAVCFCLLAVAHSVLGERLLLRPLFDTPAFAGHPLGKRFAGRTFRFAWHITSLAWIAIAAVLIAPGALVLIIGVLAVSSGVFVLLASRGQHLAWPLFFLAALGTLLASGPLSASAVAAISVALAAVLVVIALLHFYWAAGGRAGSIAVIPEIDGRPSFSPGAALTVVVALGILAFAATAVLAGGWIDAPRVIPRAAAALIALVFLARTFGDRRTVGVLKRVRGTAFARWDDRLYTPISFALSAGFVVLAAG